jgi:hypothetical protein
MPAREEINDFQKAVLENFQDGRLSDLAVLGDYKAVTARLKKESGTAVLVGLLDSLRGAGDVGEASTVFVNADIDLKAAMAAVGAVAMRTYFERRTEQRSTSTAVANTEQFEDEPEVAPALGM